MPVIGKNSQAQKIFKGFKRLGWLRGAPAMFSTYCPSYSMNSCFLYTLLDAQLSLPLVIKTLCLTLYHKLMGHAFFFDLPLCFCFWFFFTLIFFFNFDVTFTILIYDGKVGFSRYVTGEMFLLWNFTLGFVNLFMTLICS